MNLKHFLVLVVALVLGPIESQSQNSVVHWSSLSSGFGFSSSENSKLETVLGQAFVGMTKSAPTLIFSGFITGPVLSSNVTGVENEQLVPMQFALQQNYPNPFNPSTIIRYTIPERYHVSLRLFNLLGKEVVSLVDETQAQGEYTVRLTPHSLSSGVYIYRLTAGKFTEQRKLLFLK
jgi:hypothetical protein